LPIDATLVERLYRKAHGERWRVPMEQFGAALEASAARGCAERNQDPRALERYLGALHLEDLVLACACAAGDEGAWEHFVLEQRPLLYRAADALDPGGGARDLADSLYADLFGLRDRAGERQSLFRYFHGRSSLTTWLRAVLAQGMATGCGRIVAWKHCPTRNHPRPFRRPAGPSSRIGIATWS
jgi:RNA polymerase sigma-70 factor (ECF subfamily)